MPDIIGGGLFSENSIPDTTYGACIIWANGNQGKTGSKSGYDNDNSDMGIKASRYNSIYGSSDTVTPSSTSTMFYLKY